MSFISSNAFTDLKLILPLPLLMVLAACGNGAADAPLSSQAPRSLPIQAVEIGHRDLSRSIQVSSPVEPLRTIRLAAHTDGVLMEVLVEEGDVVAQGQALARIDVREQEAELARARAQLDERRANFTRLQQLLERDYVDAATFEGARAELAIAESDVRLWETRVTFGTVRSTLDGTVVRRFVEPGEAISRHEPLFSLADLENLVVRLGVSEMDIRNLRLDDAVVVRVDAVADRNPVPGTIRRIFPATEEDSRLVTVEVALPQARDFGIRPGYLARAELLVDRRVDVLAVPVAAVAQSDDSYYVLIINDDDRLERRWVEPGVIRGTWREIRDGLAPGEHVLASNPRDMAEGERVRVVDWVG